MENQLVWNDRYDIDFKVIDREHRKLFCIFDKLIAHILIEDQALDGFFERKKHGIV